MTNSAHRRILDSLTRAQREPLNEAQDYAAIYRPLIKVLRASFKGPDEEIQHLEGKVAERVAWAKRHLRRADAIVWFLRWDRLWTAYHAEEYIPQTLAAFQDDFIRRGVDPAMVRRDLPPTLRGQLVDQLEHSMSLPIRSIQNYRFAWQTPEQVITDLTEFEERHNERVADSGPVRQIDPEAIWRTEHGHRALVRVTGSEYHEKEEVILSFPDGTFWLNLNRAYCPKEAEAMTHCGNSPRQHTTDKILSLRRWVDKETGAPVMRNKHGVWTWVDPDDAPSGRDPGQVVQKVELTFILYEDGHLGEMKGPKNNTPSKRYHDHIAALLRHPIIKGIIGDGYAANMNFNVNQMDPARRSALLDDKPELNKEWFPEDKVKVVLEVNDGWTWVEMDSTDQFVTRRISINGSRDTLLSLGVWRPVKNRRVWEHHAYVLLQKTTLTRVSMSKDEASSLFASFHALVKSDMVSTVDANHYGRTIADLYTRFATPGQILEVEEKLASIASFIGMTFFSPKVYHLIPAGILAQQPVNPNLVPEVQQVPYWRARAFLSHNAHLSDVPEAIRADVFHGVTVGSMVVAADKRVDFDAIPDNEMRTEVYRLKVESGLSLDEVPDENLTSRVVEAGLLKRPDLTADPRYRDKLTPDIAATLIKNRKVEAFDHFPDTIKRDEQVVRFLFACMSVIGNQERDLKLRDDAAKAIVSLPYYEVWQKPARQILMTEWKLYSSTTQARLIPFVGQDTDLLSSLLRNHHRVVGERIFVVFSEAHDYIDPRLFHIFLEYGVVPMTSIPPDLMSQEVLLSRVLGRKESRYSHKRNGGELLEARQIPMDKWTPKLVIAIVEGSGRVDVARWYPTELITREYLDAMLSAVTDGKAIRLLFSEKPELWTPDLVAQAITREVVRDEVVWMARGEGVTRDEVFPNKVVSNLAPAVLLSEQVPYPIDETIAAAILKRKPTLVQDDKDTARIFLKPGVLAKAAASNHKVLNYLPKKYLTKTVVSATLQAHRATTRYDAYDSLRTLLGKLPRERWGKKEWQAAAASGVVPLQDVPAAFRNEDIELRAVKLDPYNMASLSDPAAWFQKHIDIAGPEPEVFAGRGGVAQTPEGWRNARDLPAIELGDTGWKLVQVAPRPRAAYAYFLLDPAKNFVLFAYWKRQKLKVPDKSRFDEARPAVAEFVRKLVEGGVHDIGELKDSGMYYDRREGTVVDRTMTKNPYAWGNNNTGKLERYVTDRADKGTIHAFRWKDDNKVVLTIRRSKNNDIESISVKDWTRALEASEELANGHNMASYQAQRLGIVSQSSGGWGKLKNPTSLRSKLIGQIGAYSVWQEKYGNRIGLFGPSGMVAFATMRKPTKHNELGIWKFHVVYGFGELSNSAEAALNRASLHIQKKDPLVYSTTKPIPVRVREAKD